MSEQLCYFFIELFENVDVNWSKNIDNNVLMKSSQGRTPLFRILRRILSELKEIWNSWGFSSELF